MTENDNQQNERPIERALRRAARKRLEQAGAPFELHPVNRRLLQEEVVKHFGSQSSGSMWSRLFAAFTFSWPRLAWAGAVALVLGVSLFLLPDRQNQTHATSVKQELALARPAEPEMADADAPPPPMQPAATPAAPRPLSGIEADAPVHDASPAAKPADKASSLRIQEGGTIAGPSATPARRYAGPDDRFKNTEQLGMELSSAIAPLKDKEESTQRGAGLAGDASSATTNSLYAGSLDAVAAATPSRLEERALSKGITDSDTNWFLIANFQTQSPAQLELSFGAMREAVAAVPAARDSNVLADETRSRSTASRSAAVKQDRYGEVVTGLARGSASAAPAASVPALSGEKAPMTSNLLTNFKVEQGGNKIRVIDADGSVYLGELQAADGASDHLAVSVGNANATSYYFDYRTTQNQPAGARGGAVGGGGGAGAFQYQAPRQQAGNKILNAEQQAQDGSSILAQQNSAYFRVSGTNRSLNRRVEFTGNLLNVQTVDGYANQANVVQNTGSNYSNAVQNNVQQNNAAQNNTILNNSNQQALRQVIGNATVEGSSQIPINALELK